MDRPKNKWPDTSAGRGALFFAQAMLAFLSEESYEGFRAYSLDTVGRLGEALTLIDDIKLKRVNKLALKPALSEIIWSVENDDAAMLIAGQQINVLIELCRDDATSLDFLSECISAIIRRVRPNYRQTISDLISKIVSDDKRRVDLLKLTGFLSSHLVNDGHSRNFLIDRTNDIFFDKEIKRAGAALIKTFVDGISQERRKYKIVCATDIPTANLLTQVGGWNVVTLDALPDHVKLEIKKLELPVKNRRFIIETEFAEDPYKAGEIVEKRFSNVKSLTIVGTLRVRLSISPTIIVFSSRSKECHTLFNEELEVGSTLSKPISGRRLKQIAKIPLIIENAFDRTSRDQLLSAFSTASVAFEARLNETRLISLWSAFEVLFSDPPEGEARIKYYAERLTPVICLRYHRRLFSAVYDRISVLSPKGMQKIMRSINDGPEDQHSKFCDIITLPEHVQLRADLLAAVNKNPLALHRLFRLHKYYGEPSDALRSIQSHAQRVEWQLHRIYRTRNNLVHAGKSPIYLESLVWNALEYFRASVTTITRKAALDTSASSVDQLIGEIGLDWRILQNTLKSARSQPFDKMLSKSVFSPL